MATTQLLLEVCIPTRKRSEYFAQAVQSVVRAATPGLSLLVFQNSTGPIWSADDLRDFPGPARLECSGEDLPIGASWNAVLSRSQAEWIHILHDDDWVEPGFYQAFLRDLGDHPPFALWACATTENYSENEIFQIIQTPDLHARDPEKIAELLLAKSQSRCASVILRRDLALKVGGFDSLMKHSLDVELFFRIALEGGVYFSSAILGHYRVHAGSSTGIGRDDRIGRMVIPALDDGRMLEDHLVFLSKQRAHTLSLSAVHRFSSGVIFGSFRYYLRRGRLLSLVLWLRCYVHHLFAFFLKSRVSQDKLEQTGAPPPRA